MAKGPLISIMSGGNHHCGFVQCLWEQEECRVEPAFRSGALSADTPCRMQDDGMKNPALASIQSGIACTPC